jgi:hypothetical protein
MGRRVQQRGADETVLKTIMDQERARLIQQMLAAHTGSC